MSPEIITTIVTVLVAVGGLVAYLERRLSTVERKIERVEDRVQSVDDRLFALATGLKPIIDHAQQASQ